MFVKPFGKSNVQPGEDRESTPNEVEKMKFHQVKKSFDQKKEWKKVSPKNFFRKKKVSSQT